MKTNSSVLSGKFWLAAVTVALFLLPVTAAAQAGNSGRDRIGNINRGRVGVVTTAEPGETLDLNAKLKIRSGGFFLENTAVLRAGRGNRVIPTSPPFDAVVLGTTNASDYLVFNAGGAERARISTEGNVGIGTTSPGAKLSFGDLNDGRNTADGITWYNATPTLYGIYRTAGSWSSPDYQQLALAWQTGIVIDGGSGYGKSGTVLQPNGGNVGIGTTTPAVKLAVQNSASFTGTSGIGGSGATADLYNNTAAAIGEGAMLTFSSNYSGGKTTRAAIKGGSEQVSWDASGYLAFYVNRPPSINTLDEMMRITTAGNVGIGTTGPTSKLHVDANNTSSGEIASYFLTASYPSIRGSMLHAGNSGGYLSAGGLQIIAQGAANSTSGSGDINFLTPTGNSANNSTDATLAERMKIRYDGNVGIGTTTTPVYKLDVEGEIRSRTGGFRFPDGTVQNTAASGGGSQWTTGSGSISYSDGNVGIGTPNPGTKLQVNGDILTNGGEARLALTQNETATRLLSYSNASSLWMLQPTTQRFVLADSLDWDRGVNFQYTAGATGAQAGELSIGQLSKNSPNFTHGTTTLYTNGAERLRINSLGSVGIGTTSPRTNYKLDVSGATSFGQATEKVNISSARVSFNRDQYSGVMTDTSVGGADLYNNAGDLTFETFNTSGTLVSTALVIKNSGNVGVGTTSPGEKLDVSGTVRATGQNASPSSGAGVEISYASNTGYIQSYNRSAGSNSALYISGNTIQLNADGQGSVGIGSASHASQLDVTGNINVTGTGNINATGTIEANNIKAKYQDVAEWVQSSEQLAAGTVVVLDSTKSNQVTSSSVSYDTRVAGVVSAHPGITLGEQSDSKVLVATTGRVKVKVDASKGPIRIGDLLVTSDVPGVAMKSEAVNLGGVQFHRPGTLIGKALEPLEKGKGEILVLLSLQ